VSYVEDLETTGDRAVFSLPLEFTSAIPIFEVHVSCDGTEIGVPLLDFLGSRNESMALVATPAKSTVRTEEGGGRGE
jgi:hypothetical protein